MKCFVESFAKDRRSRQNRNAHSFKFFHNKHFQGNSGRSFSKKLIQVMMSLTISEALCRDKRWLAEKISARFCQVIRTQRYVEYYQFIKLAATFSVEFLVFFLVVYACYLHPKSYTQIITMRCPQRGMGIWYRKHCAHFFFFFKYRTFYKTIMSFSASASFEDLYWFELVIR